MPDQFGRAHDIGLALGVLPPGPCNAIIGAAGVCIGQVMPIEEIGKAGGSACSSQRSPSWTQPCDPPGDHANTAVTARAIKMGAGDTRFINQVSPAPIFMDLPLNIAFAWRLSATRKGYAGVRLEKVK